MSAYLKVNDNGEDEHGGEQVHQIGEILAVECFPQCANFVVSRCQQMEQSNDSTFEFSAAAGVDRCRTERFPDDGLADIRRNKQRDARAKTVPFLKEFIE